MCCGVFHPPDIPPKIQFLGPMCWTEVGWNRTYKFKFYVIFKLGRRPWENTTPYDEVVGRRGFSMKLCLFEGLLEITFFPFAVYKIPTNQGTFIFWCWKCREFLRQCQESRTYQTWLRHIIVVWETITAPLLCYGGESRNSMNDLLPFFPFWIKSGENFRKSLTKMRRSSKCSFCTPNPTPKKMGVLKQNL